MIEPPHDSPLLRTLAPLLRGLERHFRAWLEGRRVYPVDIVQRAEMEGVAADIARHAAMIEQHQPVLTIMLMGGTGVGKSTLLNALAGAPVALASVTRPTTRDPVVYYHHTIPPETLDPALRACKLVSHNRPELLQKVLVDTPDLDSNDTANREKMHSLLPAADVVLYVGSQEKYHDRTVWDLLKNQRKRKAFAFVLNKWDRCVQSGSSGVRPDEDLLRDLQAEGFDSPRFFRTAAELWLGGPPAELPAGEQFQDLKAWLEHGLTRQEIEAVKARGVIQLLKQAQGVTERLKPPLLGPQAKATAAAWPHVLAQEAEEAANILAGALDPASSEIEQHFARRGQQHYRGLMAAWTRLTSMRWGLKNLLRAPLPNVPRLRLEPDTLGLDLASIARDSVEFAASRVLTPRIQALCNRLLVEADRQGLPAALLHQRLETASKRDWEQAYGKAVAAALFDVERECLQPSGFRALIKAVATGLANYLPDTLLLGSLAIVLWQFIGQQQVPSLAMMLMPVYVTIGALILLQFFMSIFFSVRWSKLREDFRKRLTRRIETELAQTYLNLPDRIIHEIESEREAIAQLKSEVDTVMTWLARKETAAKVEELYGD